MFWLNEWMTKYYFTVTYLINCFKSFWHFWQISTKSNSKWSLTDLYLTLGFSTAFLKHHKKCVLSFHMRDIKLIRLIWYIKLHGKHCLIRSDAKLSLVILWKYKFTQDDLNDSQQNLSSLNTEMFLKSCPPK